MNTVSIIVPPLRNRGDDIELLFNYFALEFGDKYSREQVFLDAEAIPLLQQYRWPGNVRELRNLVEKLTVLVKGEIVSPTVLRNNLLIQDSYLPVVRLGKEFPNHKEESDDERENHSMLLKLIYDLGKEVADLKKMIYLGIQGRDIEHERDDLYQPAPRYENNFGQPQIIEPVQPVAKEFALLEESLSLEKKEKEMILKALTRHNNNRKKAAQELGISERTLYRKIKNYDIDT